MTGFSSPSNRSKIRIFNPHRLKSQDLEESFIARQELFQSILSDLVSGKETSPPQHHLVIGQRGMGKTTLLLRLALELTREPQCQRLLPLSFPEEQYIEVDRLSKFWLNALDAMADTLEHEGRTESVSEIDEEVKRLSAIKADETTYHEACREAFTKAWTRLGRRPVLFIDNFNLLLSRLRNDDYSLRGYFSSPGAPVLVAASTVYPEEMADYGAAFYDGFKPHYLHPLTLDEVRDVLIRLARAVQKPALVDRIYSELPRLAALRDLTGGNPRTAVMLFELFADGFSEDAFEDLDALLDLVTPLYQSRMDQLSDLAQTIVGTLARNWSPMSKAEIVSQARLVDSSVPAQLGRLREIGLVEETPLFPSKKTGYQIAERFFNIWYLMRFASRRQRASLACLTRFLQEFHTPADRTRSARNLLQRDGFSRGNITYAMALAGSLHGDPALARDLEWKAQLELIQQMQGVRENIAKILDPDEIPAAVFSFAELKTRLEQAVPADCPIDGKDFARLVLGSPSLLPGCCADQKPDHALDRDRSSIAAAKLSASDVVSIAGALEEETVTLSARFSVESIRWLQTRLNAGTITDWRDAEGLSSLILLAEDPDGVRIAREFGHAKAKGKLSDAAFEKLCETLQLRPSAESTATDWFNFGYQLHVEFFRYEQAEYAYRESIQRNPNDAGSWNNLAALLQFQCGRYSESEQAYREAIRHDATSAYLWENLGTLFRFRLLRYSEAETAYRKAIQLDPSSPAPWRYLGDLYRDHLSRISDAEDAYQEAISRDPNSAGLWTSLGHLYQYHLSRNVDSEQAYREAIRLDSNYTAPWDGLGDLFQYCLDRYIESERAYREAIAIDPTDVTAWNGLGNLFHEVFNRLDEAEEAYRKALEIDTGYDSPRHNLAFLLRDIRREPAAAREILSHLCQFDQGRDTQSLHEALFYAYDNKWEPVCATLQQAWNIINGQLPPNTRDDWFRASAVLLHLRFGERFVEFLSKSGAEVSMLPWFAAVQAHSLGDKRHLLNLPVEARPAAEQIFDRIERYRKQLPAR